VPESLFSGLDDLRHIQLEDNSLASLPEDLFSELTKLRYIRLDNNNLSNLPSNLFSGLTSLREIYLYRNNLSNLPKYLFSGLTNLQSVHLYNNRNLYCRPALPSGASFVIDLLNQPDTVTANLPVCQTILLNRTTLSVDEGSSNTWTVKLSSQPSGGNVTLTISPDTANVVVLPASLTFSSTNWSSGQTVTVSAKEDDNEINEEVIITHTASGADYHSTSDSVVITLMDNDRRSIEIGPSNTASVEEVSSATWTVQLFSPSPREILQWIWS